MIQMETSCEYICDHCTKSVLEALLFPLKLHKNLRSILRLSRLSSHARTSHNRSKVSDE